MTYILPASVPLIRETLNQPGVTLEIASTRLYWCKSCSSPVYEQYSEWLEENNSELSGCDCRPPTALVSQVITAYSFKSGLRYNDAVTLSSEIRLEDRSSSQQSEIILSITLYKRTPGNSGGFWNELTWRGSFHKDLTHHVLSCSSRHTIFKKRQTFLPIVSRLPKHFAEII